MNLVDKFNSATVGYETDKSEIIEEIVNYFKDIFESGKFEKTLEKCLTKDDMDRRNKPLWVEFWNYTSGCSDTNFRVGFYEWKNPEGMGWDSRCYKGIELCSIQREVGERLLNLCIYHLKNMGFRLIIENDESWLKYYKRKITICW